MSDLTCAPSPQFEIENKKMKVNALDQIAFFAYKEIINRISENYILMDKIDHESVVDYMIDISNRIGCLAIKEG